MSRTYKDMPSRVTHPEEAFDFDRLLVYEGKHSWNCIYLQKAGVKTKKKKNVDTEHHWMTTPSWFIHDFMNQPQRIRSKQWEREIVKVPIDNLDECEAPPLGKKPHIYYW